MHRARHGPIGRRWPDRLEPRFEGRREVHVVGQPWQQSVDGAHRQLVVDELHDVGERCRRVANRAAGRLALAAVRERGLVAVVAVGDDQRLLGDGGRDRIESRGLAHDPERVPHAFGVGELGGGGLQRREEIGQALGEGETPDR